jgi:hypothetical protein
MQIFKQEIEDGLEHTISSSASISYACEVIPSLEHNNHKINNIKSLASLNDNDLYYVQSILVSSNWNKNDDIFDKDEVWAARHTPEDKPTNLEHDEATIIGHITSNWPITEEGSLIPDATPVNELPEKYHILTGSVIYKAFANPELKNRAEKLISEIEDGTKYVSMECFFKGFDYGLINKSTGEYKILPRNEDTAYLTKHLRAYGGTGEHDSYKIGRVLRDITFSGKGFVNKPANPESIIFTKNMFSKSSEKTLTEKNEDFSVSGVSDNQSNLNVENNIMNLENIQAEVIDLKAKVEAMAGCSEIVKEAYVLAAELKDKVVALETAVEAKDKTIAELTASHEALASEKEEASKKTQEDEETKEAEKAAIKAELDAANEVIAAYKSKEEEMLKKEKKMKRAASLVEVGVDLDTANATAEKFEGLDDASFDAIAELLASAKKHKKEEDKMEDKEEAAKKDKETEEEDEDAMMMKRKASEKEASEDTVDASVLETAEVESGVNLGVGGEAESAIEATRAALVEFVSSRLGKKH